MRLALSFLLFLGVSACGPSMAEVKRAKTAEYSLQTDQLLDIAMQVAQRQYKINAFDLKSATFDTVAQWYSAEGMRRGTANEGNGDYVVNMHDKDIELSLIVEVVPGPGGHSAVSVTHHTFQLLAGSPQPRPLAEGDPNVPPWVIGRVDALSLDIYNAAKKYAQPQ